MARNNPHWKREVADHLLQWLEINKHLTWSNTTKILGFASKDLDIEVFDLWKGYEILRVMGRIELNSGNGKNGAHVLDYRPLTMPALPDAKICGRETCPILKNIDRLFEEES